MHYALLLIIPLLLLGGCSAIDCPLNNTVYMQVAFKGDVDTLKDTLSVLIVRHDGSDSTIFNRGVNTVSMQLPISYQQAEDQLVFQVTDTTTKQTTNDTLRISKENRPHFENVDCSPTFFHTLTAISTTHHLIDSVVIHESEVDYDATKEHLYIYYRPRD